MEDEETATVEVNVEEAPVDEPESPPVVIVESSSESIDTGDLLALHESRHVEHESRHDDISRLISEGFDRVEGSISALEGRLGSVESRLAHTEQVAESAEETAEEIEQEIEEDEHSTPEAEEAISVEEPEPDISTESRRRTFLGSAWAGHGRE